MFFSGDLQSGIALALRESKRIVCFVRDSQEQSRLWEDHYLTSSEVTPHLQAKAVVLRIEAGSQEAEYLAAVYPLSTIPTVVIINNGQLQADLKAGVSQYHFNRDLIQALGNSSSSISPATPDISGGNSQRDLDQSLEQAPNTAANSRVRSVFDERRRRLEADKKQRDTAEKADRKAKAEARRIEAEAAAPDSARANQATYAQLQKKRQQEARQERERILKVIDNDKAERKQQEELRKALNKAQDIGNDGADGLVDKQISNEVKQLNLKDPKQCALQIRLLDGSTIRSKFSPDQTLRVDVRTWIDRERTDGDSPYNFKQIMAPMPNKAISISEEEGSLRALGLTPNATLVLTPVQGYTVAYNNEFGLISRSLNIGYQIVSGGVGLIAGAMGFLGVGQRTQFSVRHENGLEASNDASHANLQGSAQAINIRTLRDQRIILDEQQFYNGNQLNVKPRNDEEKRE